MTCKVTVVVLVCVLKNINVSFPSLSFIVHGTTITSLLLCFFFFDFPICRKHIERCTVTLISGPPGVGKRTVVRAVAKQLRLNVFEVWQTLQRL